MGAPRAFLVPISRVRSVMDTSMIFITPMPPTSREIPAIAEIAAEIVVSISCHGRHHIRHACGADFIVLIVPEIFPVEPVFQFFCEIRGIHARLRGQRDLEYPAVECACSRAVSKGRYISVEMYSSGRDVKADLSYS